VNFKLFGATPIASSSSQAWIVSSQLLICMVSSHNRIPIIERRNGRPDPNLHLVEGEPRHPHRPVLRSVGLGLISGAADDDPSAIGTYASAGAKFAFSLLWAAPAAFPMMVAVTYLCSKMSQVTGQGLFEVIREYYPRWLLHLTLIGVVIGNTIEAGADLGGVAAGVNLLVPIPIPWIVFGTAAVVFGLH
jgi:Mn2+/Fe2+ NRAMP family transporter